MATIKLKDIKLLWSKANGKCSICKCNLTTDSRKKEIYSIGEQAHIVGEKENAARGNSDLNLEERNSYHNLILLCPTCHTKIDNKSEYYTIERLHRIKSQHELEIEEALNNLNQAKKADKEFYDYIINSTSVLCNLENWVNWTSDLCSVSLRINKTTYDKLWKFTSIIYSANFRGIYIEIENSIKTLNSILYNLLTIYRKNFKQEKDFYFGNQLYRNEGEFNFNYDRDLKLYKNWEGLIIDLCFEATKAINWFAEAVRKDFDPHFFNTFGKFKLICGPYNNLEYKEFIPEFTDIEKSTLPSSYDYQYWQKQI